jgi:hypothetical protein
MTYRDTASFGKRHEYVTIAELIKQEFDVYQTLVDDQQIDCIIRNEKGGKPVYLDIQIKARSRNAQKQSWGVWPSVKILPRPNFFFIFYSEPLDRYWVIPSEILVERGYKAPSRRTEPIYEITLAHCRKSRKSQEYHFPDTEEFKEFAGAFKLLR